MKRILGTTLTVTLIQLAIFVAVLGLAGTINRSTKAGSTTSFATSNSLGNVLAVADLDTDLDTVYSTINGSIESSNIAPDTITAADIATGAVTTAEILDGNVTSVDITNDTIANVDISATAAIATTKIQSPASGSGACLAGQTAITAETTLATATLTTLGGPVLLIGGCSTSAILIGTSAKTITWSWKRDAVLIGASIFLASGPSGTSVEVPVPPPTMVDTAAAAGAHTYTLTVSTDATIQTPALFPGAIFAQESVR